MDNLILFIVGALQITLLDIVLSGDNIGVIALATKELPQEYAKKAAAIGVGAAIGLRIIFASAITYIMKIQWLPIKLIGGLLLIKITWDFIKPNQEEEAVDSVSVSKKFMGAIYSIILADLSMSLDNVLAIAAAANGRIELIIFGLVLNIPIIFFGSQYVANLMRKYPIVIYIGGSILAHTAFKMFLEDRIISTLIPHNAVIIVPYIIAVITLIYGYIIIKKKK